MSDVNASTHAATTTSAATPCTTTNPQQKKKIAVIGSGIAGLSCCWILTQAGFSVTLFERESRLGMDAHGVDLEDG